MPDSDERQQQILRAAAAVIVRQGYDKTTMSDIADEAGVSRGTVYLHFKGKDELFEALVYHEVQRYAEAWLEHIEADPRGGTIGGIYRAFLYAINSRPFMAAMMRRDRQVFGSYLRKPDSLLAGVQSPSIGAGLLQALQQAGAVRQDLDPKLMAHVIDVVAYGLMSVPDFKNPDDLPPFDAVIETITEMMDWRMTPEEGGNSNAGKAVIRQLAAALRVQFEQTKSRKEGNS